MDYLVIAPHTPFFQWQIALLVQSFRLLGMEENLAVMLVVNGSEELVQSVYCGHFFNHPRLRAVRLATDPNPDIARLHGIAYAVKNGLVSQNFVLLPPHCLLRSPLQRSTANVTFSCQTDFTFPQLDGFGISSTAISKRMGNKRQWLPVGEVFQFTEMMPEFFDLVSSRGEMIAFDSYREQFKKGEVQKPRCLLRGAFSLTLMEAFSQITVDTCRRLECKMNEQDQDSPVINYYYGCPPEFSRTYYPMNGSSVTFSDNPFDGILRTPETFPSLYMKKIVSTLRK